MDPAWEDKVNNLATGIEILGLGCEFHLFDPEDFGRKKIRGNEENYTINLLFGDVFYSRAVKYLLGFEDTLVFEEVINALKHMHKNRLLCHRELLKVAEKPALLEPLLDKRGLLLGINSLYKSSFLLGWSIFLEKGKALDVDIGILYKIFNYITLIKSYEQLKTFLPKVSSKLGLGLEVSLLNDKRGSVAGKLASVLSGLEPDWLKKRMGILGSTGGDIR